MDNYIKLRLQCHLQPKLIQCGDKYIIGFYDRSGAFICQYEKEYNSKTAAEHILKHYINNYGDKDLKQTEENKNA